MYIEELKPGVLRISASPDWPKPYIGVGGSMHGNEPCGAEAIRRIARAFESGDLAPAKGTIFLVHANPEATLQGLRHTPEGDDLNRVWDFLYTQTLREEAWGYEHHRALELKAVLGELDVFLDLHSARTATPAFGVSNGEAPIDEIAKQIGIAYLVQSWYGLADKVIIGFLKLAGIPALSVECGAHDDPAISETAQRIAMSFLRATGGHEQHRLPNAICQDIEIDWNHQAGHPQHNDPFSRKPVCQLPAQNRTKRRTEHKNTR